MWLAVLLPVATVLLCTYGLTDMVPEARIASILSTSDVSSAAALVTAALTAGGADNVSAVVISVPA